MEMLRAHKLPSTHTGVVESVKGCSFVCSWMVEVGLSWWNGSFVKETLEGRVWRLYIHSIHSLDHRVSLFPSLNAFLVLWLISLFWTHVPLLFYQWDQKLVHNFSQFFFNILIKQPKSILSMVLFLFVFCLILSVAVKYSHTLSLCPIFYFKYILCSSPQLTLPIFAFVCFK